MGLNLFATPIFHLNIFALVHNFSCPNPTHFCACIILPVYYYLGCFQSNYVAHSRGKTLDQSAAVLSFIFSLHISRNCSNHSLNVSTQCSLQQIHWFCLGSLKAFHVFVLFFFSLFGHKASILTGRGRMFPPKTPSLLATGRKQHLH